MKNLILVAILLSMFSCLPLEDDYTTEGDVVIWKSSDCGNMEIYIDDEFVGTLTGVHSNSSIDCNSSGAVTKTIGYGLHEIKAKREDGTIYTTTVYLTSNYCNEVEIPCSGTGGGNNGGNNSGNNGGGNGNGSSPSRTMPQTQFMGNQCKSLSGNGDWWMEEFTISSSTDLVIRFASRYAADAAVIVPGQVSAFKNNQSFSGYGSFDDKIGYQILTLSPGTYYLAVRNQVNGENTISVELDYDIRLPASDNCTFVDNYIKKVDTYQAGQKMWHSFTVQDGYRYFLDGCSSGMDVYIIPQSQLGNFQNGQSFQYYSDYYNSSCGSAPGLWEIELPAGTYYMVAQNTTSSSQSMVYNMERWRQD